MEEEDHVIFPDGRILPLGEATHIFVDYEVIHEREFCEHPYIIEVICSENVEGIYGAAFAQCPSLRRLIMPGVKLAEAATFFGSEALEDVECGKLEIIKGCAFAGCKSLRSINLPSVRIVEELGFAGCALSEVTFGSKLDRIEESVFSGCTALERLTIPLKDGIIASDDIFQGCENLNHVDLVEGEVHATIASFDSEEWKDDMHREIDSINQILPNACAGYYDEEEEEWFEGEKAQVIRTWIRSVIDKMNHYKAGHRRFLNEAATLLELAIWKANLDDNNGGRNMSVREGVRTTRGSVKRARRELCVTSGASIVIKNVLPFLELKS